MNHTGPVSNGEGGADLLDHRDRPVETPRSIQGAGLETASPQQTHDEVRRARLAPIVDERHDVRVLEVRYEVRFGLEPANELWPVGELGPDLLDRHLTTDRRLETSIHNRERSLTKPFCDVVSQQCPFSGWRIESRIALEDLALEFAGLFGRLEADFGQFISV